MNTRRDDAETQRRSKLRRIVDMAILVTLAALLFHPEGIVGRWVADAYGERQERRKIAEIWGELSVANSRLGSVGNNRTIVEFIDYECPSCRSTAPAVSNAVRQGVTVVFRHFPLTQIHPAARDAALAAICAERYGVFAEVHEAMLTDDTWMAEQHWGEWSTQIGMIEEGAFEACMVDEETLHRLRKDRELAELLGIRGTPSFVTPEGVFLGADGWTQALATLPPNIQDSVTVSTSTFELSTDTIFDSAAHPNTAIATLAKLSKAMFLRNDRLLIQDGVFFHFVDIQTEEVVTAGGNGRGPGEFETPFQTIRSPNGVVVWDVVLGRLTLLSETGEYIDSRRFDIGPLQSPMAPLVAYFQDESVVFRDDSTAATGSWPRGLHREPVRYVKFSQDGRSTLLHSARGSEVVYQEPMSAQILFAHRVLESSLGDALVVAQTDLSTIRVYDSIGNVTSELPMPAMVEVSRRQIEDAREAATEEEQARYSRLGRRLGFAPGSRNWLSDELPANDPAPPIDEMFTDLDNRLWLRQYRMPGRTVALWEAWRVDDAKIDARISIRQGEGVLLDVQGDKALLHVKDAFDVDRVVVRRMVTRPTI